MSDPYRSEDQVAKLQAENEKLQKEKDELMARFGLLKKWPAYLFFGLMIGMVAFGSFWAGRSVSPANLERTRISSYDYHRIYPDERSKIAADVVQKLTPVLAFHTRETPPLATCPAPPVCADGVDEHMLGMNKVVSGTIGGSETGPRSEDWRFSAQTGDMVIFRIKKSSGGFDPFLVVSDEQGNVLVSHGNINILNRDATVRYRFAHNGIYILRCMDESSQPGEGSYTLSATRVRTP